VPAKLLSRISPAAWRWTIVGLIVVGWIVGMWMQATATEASSLDACWFPGVPRYPNAHVSNILHDASSWHGSLNSRDGAEQVGAYYKETFSAAEIDGPPASGRFSWVSLSAKHPSGSNVMISIMEDHPGESKWNPLNWFDTGTQISILVLPPIEAGIVADWPFGPEHPKHRNWSLALGNAIGKALAGDSK